MTWYTNAAVGMLLLSGPLGYLDGDGCDGGMTDTPPAIDTPTPAPPTRAPTVAPPTPTRPPTPTPAAPTVAPTRPPTPTATATPAAPTVAPTPTDAPPTVPPTPVVRGYRFDDAESLLYVQVFHVPGSSGHDHVIRATGYEGFVEFSPDDPSICTVDVSFFVEEMGVDEDYMRDLVGYDQHLTASARSSIRSTMLSEDQLYSVMYPTIAYEATACEKVGSDWRVFGDLTIRGVSVNVPVDLQVVEGPGGLEVNGSLVFKQSWFGFEPYKLLTFENGDDTTLTLDVIGHPLAR